MSDVQLIYDLLFAQSFAVRNAVAYLIAIEASKADDPDHVFKDMAEALKNRLDELPPFRADLKEKVAVETDWIVEVAQVFYQLRQK